jgi:hypothetical protein
MLILKEISKWPDATPNHTYVVSDNKEFVYGYIRAGELKIELFSKRGRFHARYRKFKLLGKVSDDKILKGRPASPVQ